MAEFVVKEVEVAKELPNFSGGPAKAWKLTFESGESAELFVMDSNPAPVVGDKLDGAIEIDPQFGPKFKKAGGRGGGRGGQYRQKMDPTEAKAVQRQHSQEMANQREANLVAAGHRPLNDEQFAALTTWFQDDIAGKSGAGIITGILTSDVPADDDGLP